MQEFLLVWALMHLKELQRNIKMKNKMCGSGCCFSKEEKIKLKKKGWTIKQINFVENSIVENKIKQFIK